MRRATVPAWDSRAAQTAQPVVSRSAPPRRLDGVATSIFFIGIIASKARFASQTPRRVYGSKGRKSSAIIRSERPCGEDTHQ